jgi:hypothetical protein
MPPPRRLMRIYHPGCSELGLRQDSQSAGLVFHCTASHRVFVVATGNGRPASTYEAHCSRQLHCHSLRLILSATPATASASCFLSPRPACDFLNPPPTMGLHARAPCPSRFAPTAVSSCNASSHTIRVRSSSFRWPTVRVSLTQSPPVPHSVTNHACFLIDTLGALTRV